ncbi:odorant receptor 4-like [Xylocopa sonorina]|uniref:odorant receptor 4-like n=1 Tax=Xylocopa sonorina TaxID=1818115 RepID=UPI00403B0B52
MTSNSTVSSSMKYGLHITVIWPGTPLPLLRKFCWLIVLGAFQTCQYSYVITHLKSDTLIEIVDNLSICLPYTLLYIKLCIVWTNPSLLREILSIMEEECRKYAVLDKHNFISKAAHLSYYLTSSVMCIHITSSTFYVLGVLMPHGNATTSRELLLKMNLPFDTNESPIYELVVSAQIICQTVTAYAFGFFGGLLLMVVLHVGCQIDVMCQVLMEVPHKNKKHLRFLVSRHQEIIAFVDKIEKLFTFMALSQVVSNTILICCLGYIIIIAIQIEDGFALLMKCVLFYIGICSELFIYCFAGEYLSTKSQLISDTAYKFLWYNLHPNDSRILILVILRSQKGFTVTFGKFANLSMENFMAIMKSAASYVSVLLAMT